jgi:hypothetical protein
MTYEGAFNTWINWNIDIIFVSDRTGELHNTQFLEALEKWGALERIKHLAIDERVWRTTKLIPGADRLKFKNCSHVGMLRHMKHL